jgi:hypothetical protein
MVTPIGTPTYGIVSSGFNWTVVIVMAAVLVGVLVVTAVIIGLVKWAKKK